MKSKIGFCERTRRKKKLKRKRVKWEIEQEKLGEKNRCEKVSLDKDFEGEKKRIKWKRNEGKKWLRIEMKKWLNNGSKEGKVVEEKEKDRIR